MADDLPNPLPIRQVRMKSYLPSRKTFLSRTTGRHLFWALCYILLFTTKLNSNLQFSYPCLSWNSIHCIAYCKTTNKYIVFIHNPKWLVICWCHLIPSQGWQREFVQGSSCCCPREVVNSVLHEGNYTGLRHTTYMFSPSRKLPLSWGYNIRLKQ